MNQHKLPAPQHSKNKLKPPACHPELTSAAAQTSVSGVLSVKPNRRRQRQLGKNPEGPFQAKRSDWDPF
ncbi:hypothetical protein N7490_002877 [Penicillium lividum]|nr:hypothetical protein N7490_002877 [Penicillium lividum]